MPCEANSVAAVELERAGMAGEPESFGMVLSEKIEKPPSPCIGESFILSSFPVELAINLEVYTIF